MPVGPISRMLDLASSTSLFFVRVVQALVVVVHRDREHLLGVVLADHVVVEDFADFLRRRHAVLGFDEGDLVLFADDIHAQLDAFIADEHGRARDELADLMLALAAERAIQRALGVAAGGLGHGRFSLSRRPDGLPSLTSPRGRSPPYQCRIRAAGCLSLDIPRSAPGSQALRAGSRQLAARRPDSRALRRS